jgi:hypothetical protein
MIKLIGHSLLMAAIFLTSLSPEVFADKSNSNVLGVRQLMTNPDQYAAKIQVEGIATQIYPDRHLVTLIDLQEFKDCNSVTCAKLTLPVRWEGEMPNSKDYLRIDGSIQKEDGKMIFIAESLMKVQKPTQ